MRTLRFVGVELRQERRQEMRERRRSTDLLSVVRCPRCGGELIARVAHGQAAFWCHCPVKRALAMGA